MGASCPLVRMVKKSTSLGRFPGIDLWHFLATSFRTSGISSLASLNRGSEWGGPLVGCRLKFSNFVGSRLKFSIFVGSRLNVSIFVGRRKISVNK